MPGQSSDAHGHLIAASKGNGTNVYNLAGGSVYDVMLAKGSGKAEYAIMIFGGFQKDRWAQRPHMDRTYALTGEAQGAATS